MQVFGPFAQTDISDRYLELVAYADDHSAFRTAVQLRNGHTGDFGGGGELLSLFKGILTGTAVQDEHNIMRSIGHEFLHDALYLGELVHQALLVMQAACGIDEDYIHPVGDSAVQCVVSHAGRVASHLLLYDGHTDSLAPDAYLLHSSSTEGVGSSQTDFQTCLLELIGQFADGCRLAHTVYANHKNDVGTLVFRNLKSLGIVCVIFRE